MKRSFKYLFIWLFWFALKTTGQNQNSKWYFGNKAGLDFMTNPPTVLTGSMNAFEACSSISDASGNLLFYTDGVSVWNKQHQVMANGTGLLGGLSGFNSGYIVKQPGNKNIYFIFTVPELGMSNGLRYTTVDMSLAAGMGSVTVKNTLVAPTSTEKLAATRHCNGVDIWMVSHDYPGDNFRAFQVTSAGVSTTAVISAVGYSLTYQYAAEGCIMISPSGDKLCMSLYASLSPTAPEPTFELYDFDNTTGVVSNALTLNNNRAGEACEFSADGTKLYGCQPDKYLLQWDLCAGSNTAIVASQYTVASWIPANNPGRGHMRRAINGKIYLVVIGTSDLDVIGNPNAGGAACNYIANGQSASPNLNKFGLPNFMFEKILPSPFTYTLNAAIDCKALTFTSSPLTNTLTTCTSVGYSVTNMTWDFGDPGSGPSNTSNLPNPTHVYPGPGTYTAQLIYYYTCGGGTDTLRQQVTVSNCNGIRPMYDDLPVNIYPNPFSSELTIESTNKLQVSLYNKWGMLFMEEVLHTGSNKIDLSGLSKGIYMLVCRDGENIRRLKLVKTD